VARERQQARANSLGWTAEKLAHREQIAGERLQRDADYIGWWVQRDVERTKLIPGAVQQYVEFDIRRWQERQSDYLSYTGRTLRGKPEQTEPTAIIMFY
jgi:hypothetical protein